MADKDYKKLNKYENYDKEAAEELAEAVIELGTLKSRARYLEQLIADNKELMPFLWTTAEGLTLPLHKIEDDHLGNILLHLNRGMRDIPKSIVAEANRRGITVPSFDRKQAVLDMYASKDRFAVDAELVDEIPF